jgi:hypothetical protein
MTMNRDKKLIITPVAPYSFQEASGEALAVLETP